MLKLNIQYFADGETTSVDTTAVSQEQQTVEQTAAEIQEEAQGAKKDVESLASDQALQSVAGDAIQKAFDYISPKLGEFQTVVGDLGKFLSYVVTTYEFSDEQMKKEFDAWSNTITGAVNNVKSGLTEVSTGYTSTQYVSELSASTQNIVKEVSNMVSSTGKLYSSATGKSVLTSVGDLGKATVGTINTLFSAIGSGDFSSIMPGFVGSIMGK